MSIFGQKLPHEANKYIKKYVGTFRLASVDIVTLSKSLYGLTTQTKIGRSWQHFDARFRATYSRIFLNFIYYKIVGLGSGRYWHKLYFCLCQILSRAPYNAISRVFKKSPKFYAKIQSPKFYADKKLSKNHKSLLIGTLYTKLGKCPLLCIHYKSIIRG